MREWWDLRNLWRRRFNSYTKLNLLGRYPRCRFCHPRRRVVRATRVRLWSPLWGVVDAIDTKPCGIHNIADGDVNLAGSWIRRTTYICGSISSFYNAREHFSTYVGVWSHASIAYGYHVFQVTFSCYVHIFAVWRHLCPLLAHNTSLHGRVPMQSSRARIFY